jgi:hypothetical protein
VIVLEKISKVRLTFHNKSVDAKGCKFIAAGVDFYFRGVQNAFNILHKCSLTKKKPARRTVRSDPESDSRNRETDYRTDVRADSS